MQNGYFYIEMIFLLKILDKYKKELVASVCGEQLISFLASMKVSAINSLSGAIPSHLLFNHFIMDLVDAVTDDYLYSEHGKFVIPFKDERFNMSNEVIQDLLNTCISLYK